VFSRALFTEAAAESRGMKEVRCEDIKLPSERKVITKHEGTKVASCNIESKRLNSFNANETP
jgi:hypothetical protein